MVSAFWPLRRTELAGKVDGKQLEVEDMTLRLRIFHSTALIALLTVGCATTPVPTDEATPVPLDRVTARSLLEPRPGTAALTIKRDQGLSSSACRTRVYIDGTPAAEIGTGERVTFHLTIGAHMVAIMAAGICAGGLTEATVAIEQGRPLVYRISYGSSGDFKLQPTSF